MGKTMPFLPPMTRNGLYHLCIQIAIFLGDVHDIVVDILVSNKSNDGSYKNSGS